LYKEQKGTFEFTVHKGVNWPILIREKVIKSFNDDIFRAFHVIGQRRVGKTLAVKMAAKPNSIYIDFKRLPDYEKIGITLPIPTSTTSTTPED